MVSHLKSGTIHLEKMMKKNRELLSLLLQVKDSQERNSRVLTTEGLYPYNLNLINKAIAIVEDTIRYRQAFFTEE